MREGWRGVEGKTNYRPDNRQAMDFLPGLFCSSSILFLSLSVYFCLSVPVVNLNSQFRVALLT